MLSVVYVLYNPTNIQLVAAIYHDHYTIPLVSHTYF